MLLAFIMANQSVSGSAHHTLITSHNISIFRRDFRIVDNNGLNDLDGKKLPIWPIFIFNPAQVDPKKNRFCSNNSLQFLVESLADLQKRLRAIDSDLTFLHGNTEEVMEALASLKPAQVQSNKDYTPYARERAAKLDRICKARSIIFAEVEDYLLNPISIEIFNGSGEAFVKFTPYYHKALTHPIDKPSKHKPTHLMSPSQQKKLLAKLPKSFHYSLDEAKTLYTPNPNLAHRGGRTAGLTVLKSIGRRTQPYASTHNTLSHSTSEMSAYNKFGCFSIREVYYEIRAQIPNSPSRTALLRQLYWRDFYYRIAWYYPNVISARSTHNRNFNPRYSHVPWYSSLRTDHVSYVAPTKKAAQEFKAWCDGRTGIPIVDACMRQLNATGFMHNRGRLIVSGFLIKNLHWSWEDGELYFARHLYDYDPAQNSGGWQWSSGSGTDSQPYFRILNPWKQGLDHDPEAVYIKHWVPELDHLPAEHIHKWYDYCSYGEYSSVKYPAPIIDVSESVTETRKLYAKGLK